MRHLLILLATAWFAGLASQAQASDSLTDITHPGVHLLGFSGKKMGLLVETVDRGARPGPSLLVRIRRPDGFPVKRAALGTGTRAVQKALEGVKFEEPKERGVRAGRGLLLPDSRLWLKATGDGLVAWSGGKWQRIPVGAAALGGQGLQAIAVSPNGAYAVAILSYDSGGSRARARWAWMEFSLLAIPESARLDEADRDALLAGTLPTGSQDAPAAVRPSE